MSRKTDGTIRSIQIDIPAEAYDLLSEVVKVRRKVNKKETLTLFIRQALAKELGVEPEFFSPGEWGGSRKSKGDASDGT